MKVTTVAGLLASALQAQQAVATYGWGNAQQFSSPENCNNTCEGQQSGGWSFGNVPTGNVGSFDGFGMQGFGCSDSFGSTGGRRGLTKRFANKALVGKATNDDASCPKISSDRDFSISQFHMSTDKENQNVELHYDMPDGSVCKQKTTCGTNPQQFDNSQCGGAKQVRVRGDCSVAFHSFSFDCNPPPPPPSTTPPTTTSSKPPTTTTTQPPVTTTTGCKENETPNTGGVCVPKTSSTTTTSSCKDTETPNDKGVCVPKTTPPVTTPPVTTPPVTTTSSSTSSCKDTETPNDKGVCVPKTTATPPVTTTTSCAENQTPNDKGQCVPKTTSTSPSTSSSTSTSTSTTATCKEGEKPNDKGECVPQTTTVPTTSTTATQPPTTTTATCKVGEKPNDKGECVPGSTPPVTTTATTSCGQGSTMDLGKSSCVPTPPVTTATTTAQTTTCGEGSTMDLGKSSCVPTPPVTSATTSVVTTTTCGEGSTMDLGKSSCVPKSVTGGTGTPSSVLPSTSSCGEGSTFTAGTCKSTGILTTTVPSTSVITTTSASTSCASGSTMEGNVCKPTGGITTTSTTSAVPTCNGNEEFKNGKCIPKTPTGGQSSSTTVSAVNPPKSPPPEAGCPLVLPRCISTWIQKAGCSSNSDTACICPKKDLITNVQSCVEAWGGSDADIQSAYSFLVGLCADFVPQNPQICTGVPSTVTLVPQPPQVPVTGGSGAPAPTQPPSLPSTVITFTRTQSTTTLTQTVTVPQVSFNTITQHVPVTGGAAGPTQGGVGLVPALPLTETGSKPSGAPAPPTAVPGGATPTTFLAWSSAGASVAPTKTGNSPISTFTGAANKPAYAVAAGLLGVVAFFA